MPKECPTCGLINPPEGQRCDCGYKFNSGAPDQPRYKGVAGWLRWICLGFTVLSPLLTLIVLANNYSGSAQYFGRVPRLSTLWSRSTRSWLSRSCHLAFMRE
jgi:hypothetical protein